MTIAFQTKKRTPILLVLLLARGKSIEILDAHLEEDIDPG